jgi:hypothetical protein
LWFVDRSFQERKKAMNRACWILGALVLASPAVMAADDKAAATEREKAAVVDPLDLRKPIPDPEAGLTEKYDGKLVRFTGQVAASGQDSKTNTHWYDLQTTIVHRAGVVNGKKPAAAQKAQPTVKEVVVVRAYFATAQKLRVQPAGDPVLVEGRGEISLVDGTLSIRKAAVLDPRFIAKEPASKP